MKIATSSVGAFEAKNRFSELLERVLHGTEITITKHDRPVAKLVPAVEATGIERKRRTQELRALRERYSLKGISVRDLIDEGRR